MNITVIGCGNGGSAIAADLSLKGHSITMLKTSSLVNDHYLYLKNHHEIIINRNNISKKAKIDLVTENFEEAINDKCDLIILFVQTNFHEVVIKKMSPYLKENQVVLVEPGYFATSIFLDCCPNKKLTIVEAESSPIDCRITSPGRVDVLFENVRNPLGVYPNSRKDKVKVLLSELGYNFTYLDSVLEAALHNPNLIVHTIGAILSIPRIENTNGEYWMYREVFTPSVWNLVEKLDEEKNNVLSSFNFSKKKYVDACKFRNSEDLSLDSKSIFMDYALNYSPKGPDVSDSRFITEDVPFGLVMLEKLGEYSNNDMIATTTLINLANLLHKKDYRATGRKINLDTLNFILEVEEKC